MGKNIVFCADGTWNGPGNDDNGDGIPDTTNVWKLFTSLAGELDVSTALQANEQEKIAVAPKSQIAKYLHGVGDSFNPIHKLLGGVFGAGVIARIVRGYTYISRHYEEGDRIYLVGFSRGAYTVRALAAMILDCGVLDRNRFDLQDKALAYRLGTMAWRAHRQARVEMRAHREPSVAKRASIIDWFRRVVDDLPAFASSDLSPDDYSAVPSIRAVAVWDTVGALGIPVYVDGDGDETTAEDRRRADAYRFADTNLNERVKFGFHAISLDERRGDFEPTLWADRSDVTQVLFPGAHADVGGGYPNTNGESGLSDIALEWMFRCLSKPGVDMFFDGPPQPMEPNALGPAHEPWKTGAFKSRPELPRVTLQHHPGKIYAHSSIRNRREALRVMGAPGLEPGAYKPTVWSDIFDTRWVD